MTGLLQSRRGHTARRRIADCLETATHYRAAALCAAERQPSNWSALIQGCIERAQREEERVVSRIDQVVISTGTSPEIRKSPRSAAADCRTRTPPPLSCGGRRIFEALCTAAG